MLNKETKDKINRCRDILVGQLPLPSDQVELITVTLIYKFMDDMDEQSKKLGGEVSFFRNGLGDYSWQKLMSNQLSGDERLAKFIKAIEAISRAEHIQDLFKSIFRNTFLKFRDARTLKLFLDEINTFNYSHSEELGNAFEYLLNSMGTQGENGQFRTPRNIIDFIVEVVDPDKTDKILDPACGTAGFLISAYKHILRKNTTGYEDYRVSLKNYEIEGMDIKWGNKLLQTEKEKISKQIEGYDITPLMVRLSQVNMYLHNFPNPLIHDYDTLSNQNRWNDKYDCILANPPFMTPKGGVRPHKQFYISANKAEILFSDYILEHLTPNGKAGWIVPEGIVFQNSNDYVKLRQWLINTMGLWAVVSLPAQIFQPYSGVKTSILFVDRAFARTVENVMMVKVENDGFSLNTNRNPIKGNDLPAALNLLTSYKKSPNLYAKEVALDFSRVYVKAKLLHRKEFEKLDSYKSFTAAINFIQKNFKSYQKVKEKQKPKAEKDFLSKTGLSRLPKDEDESRVIAEEEIKDAVISYGEDRVKYYGLTAELQKNIDGHREYSLSYDRYLIEFQEFDGRFPLVKLHEVMILEYGKSLKASKRESGEYPVYGSNGVVDYHNDFLIEAPFIVVGRKGSAGEIHFSTQNGFPIDTTFYVRLKDQSKLHLRYLFYTLKRLNLPSLNNQAGVPGINRNDVYDLSIPLPPIEIQEEIVDEIEQYQKVIDGCNLVIENYNPSFKIDEKWERLNLGDIMKLSSGRFLPKSLQKEGEYNVYGGNGIVGKHSDYFIEEETLMIGRVGAYCGVVHITSPKSWVTDNGLYVTEYLRPVNQKFLAHILSDASLNLFAKVGGQPSISQTTIYSLIISLPPVEIQNEVVTTLEDQQKVIENCKSLKGQMETKIKEVIDGLWEQ